MTAPRSAKFGWSPRSFLVTPKNFGRFREVAWVPEPTDGDNQQRDRWQVAQWQHTVCHLVRDAAQYREMSLDVVAAETRMGPEHFWRLMRGDGPMKLEDFAAFQRIFDIRFDVGGDVQGRVGFDVER